MAPAGLRVAGVWVSASLHVLGCVESRVWAQWTNRIEASFPDRLRSAIEVGETRFHSCSRGVWAACPRPWSHGDRACGSQDSAVGACGRRASWARGGCGQQQREGEQEQEQDPASSVQSRPDQARRGGASQIRHKAEETRAEQSGAEQSRAEQSGAGAGRAEQRRGEERREDQRGCQKGRGEPERVVSRVAVP